MSSTFTPGPWSVGKKTGTLIFTGPDGGMGDFICEVSGEDDTPREVNKANARLIAASPTMYETLVLAEELLSFHEGCAKPEFDGAHPTLRINGEDFANLLADIRAALSKAAGEGV